MGQVDFVGQPTIGEEGVGVDQVELVEGIALFEVLPDLIVLEVEDIAVRLAEGFYNLTVVPLSGQAVFGKFFGNGDIDVEGHSRGNLPVIEVLVERGGGIIRINMEDVHKRRPFC